MESRLARFLLDYKWSIALSVVVGLAFAVGMGDSLAGITIGLLVNIISMLAEHFTTVQRLGTYIDTHREVVDSEKEVVALAAAMREVKLECPPLARDVAREAVVRLGNDLRALCSGQWTVRSFDAFADVASLFFGEKGVSREYLGTSVVKDYDQYWKSGAVTRFQKASDDAISRGVKVKRVFICPDGEIGAIAGVMQGQAAQGIEVRYLVESEMPHGVACIDCGIWDRRYAVELTQSRNRGAEFQATFHTKQTSVDHYINAFDALFEAARPYRPDDAATRVPGT